MKRPTAAIVLALVALVTAVLALRTTRPAPRAAIREKPATELRRDARLKPALIRDLAALVQEAPEWTPEREKAAFVLGSLGRTAELLKALAAARDPKWIRLLLFALGADRDLTTDNLFNLPPDGPWVIVTPGGLRVRIYAWLDDAARAAVGRFLTDPSEDLRWVAARVLRHSLEAKDTCDLFFDRLRDPSADVQEEIADALAPHARRDPRILPEILELSVASERVRFKIEDSLRDIKLTGEELQGFARTMSTSSDQGLRLWCFEVLSAQPSEGFVATARALLLTDSNPKIREKAARLVTNQETLAQGLRDPEWNVRLACVQSLTDRAALQAALNDPDERVRAAAEARLR